MKLDQIIRKFLPKDDKFFTLLEESTDNLVKASVVMQKLALSKKQAESGV